MHVRADPNVTLADPSQARADSSEARADPASVRADAAAGGDSLRAQPSFADPNKAQAWGKLTALQQRMQSLIAAVEGQLSLRDVGEAVGDLTIPTESQLTTDRTEDTARDPINPNEEGQLGLHSSGVLGRDPILPIGNRLSLHEGGSAQDTANPAAESQLSSDAAGESSKNHAVPSETARTAGDQCMSQDNAENSAQGLHQVDGAAAGDQVAPADPAVHPTTDGQDTDRRNLEARAELDSHTAGLQTVPTGPAQSVGEAEGGKLGAGGSAQSQQQTFDHSTACTACANPAGEALESHVPHVDSMPALTQGQIAVQPDDKQQVCRAPNCILICPKGILAPLCFVT